MSPRGPTRQLGVRARLLWSVLLTLGLVLAGLAAAFNLVLADRLDADANSVLSARASAELAAVRVAGGRVTLPEAPDAASPDTSTWVFAGNHPIEVPQSSSVDPAAASAVATSAPARRDVADGTIRLYSLPISAGGRTVGAVVVGLSLAPYNQTHRTALIASLLLALVAFIAVGLASNWLIRRALGPVSQMTGLAAQWSEQAIDRRFAVGPPHDEFTQLAFTLNGLLDRVASSLRHEQRLSAELSHELRTPLANVAAQAQYALRHGEPTEEQRQALANILSSTQQMSRTLDTLIAAARAELDPRGTVSSAAAGVGAAVDAFAQLAAQQGVDLVVAPCAESANLAVEQHLVERILAPVIENACRHAGHRIVVRPEPDASTVRILVEDDGPGIPDEDLERVFEPGWQGSPGRAGTTTVVGAGLGLSLARRLARSAGGDVRAEAKDGGARIVVELPSARGRSSDHA